MEDILRQVLDLRQRHDREGIDESLGKVLCSCFQLANEQGLAVDAVMSRVLAQIERRRFQYATLGRRLEVALFGGAFDPVTWGHVEAAQCVLEAANVDEVWLMPCFTHRHGKQMVDPQKRLEMVRLASEIDVRIKPFSYEIDAEMSGSTYDLVIRLLQEPFVQNRYSFSFIIGQDNADSFEKWENHELLRKAIRFIVVPRTGVAVTPPEDAWYLRDGHIWLSPEKPIREICSTEFRQRMREGDDTVSQLVPDSVYKFVKENHLYQ